MKKTMLIIFLNLFLLSGCANRAISCYDLFSAIDPIEYHTETYSYEADNTDGKFFQRLYLGTVEDSVEPHAFSYCDDYFIVLGSGSDLWEIHIFHLISLYYRDRVESMLATRKDRLQNSQNMSFYSEITKVRVENARIISYRDYVLLLITDQNDMIETTVKNLLQ